MWHGVLILLLMIPCRWLALVMCLVCGVEAAFCQPDRVYRSVDDIEEPSKVYVLHLNYKRLKSIPPKVFECCNLRELSLAHNRIDTIPPDIARLSNLEILDLGQNRLSSLPIEVALLPRLKVLDVNRNLIVELPEGLGYVASLERLVLWRTGVWRLPESFANLNSHLLLLDLRSCMISRDEQRAISALLPDVRIMWDQACNCR